MTTAKQSQTTAARLARIERALEALLAQPAVSAPVVAQAKSPVGPTQFVLDMRARAAAKVACEVHSAKVCNRRFSPTSAGVSNHVARLV